MNLEVDKKPVRPCAKGHRNEVKTIGLSIGKLNGETKQETYARWARMNGLNPWCGNRLIECPEPIR